MKVLWFVGIGGWITSACLVVGCTAPSDPSILLPTTHADPAGGARAVLAQVTLSEYGPWAGEVSTIVIEGEYSNQSRKCSGSPSEGYPRKMVPFAGRTPILPTWLAGPSSKCPLLLTSVQAVLRDKVGKDLARASGRLTPAQSGAEDQTCFVGSPVGLCLFNNAATLEVQNRRPEHWAKTKIAVVRVSWHAQTGT